MKQNLIILFVALLITSCGKDENELREERKQRFENEVQSFVSQYEVYKNIDTIDYRYTLDFQLLTNSNHLFYSKTFRLHDIYIDKGNYFITGETFEFKADNYHFKLISSKPMISRIRNNYDYKNQRICPVFRIKKITKLKLQASVDMEIEEYEGEFEYIPFITLNNYYSDKDFLVLGELVDLLIISEQAV